jgi:hypothetical protein
MYTEEEFLTQDLHERQKNICVQKDYYGKPQTDVQFPLDSFNTLVEMKQLQ